MPAVTEITDRAHSGLKNYRAIRDPELAREHGLFVAEGRLVVERLIASGRHRIESVLVTPPALAALASSLERLPASTPVFVVTAAVMAQVAGFTLHRGCVALGIRGARPGWDDALAGAPQTVVVLEGVTNPDNVGGVFRTGQALGADAVLLSDDCSDPFYRKAIRTSMGAVFDVPFGFYRDIARLADALRSAGYMIAALTPAAGAVAIADAARLAMDADKVALLIGTEGHGLTALATQAAELQIRIPMRPGVDSLNLTVATAVALSHIRGGAIQ